MIKIIVTSINPVKTKAVRIAFKKMFPKKTFKVESYPVSSGVRSQPMSDAETYKGALNRVTAASVKVPEADFWVGIEGGVEEKNNEMEVFAWIVIKSNENLVGKGRTGTFFLPPKVSDLIHQGKELGEADDIVFGKMNSKQKNGAVGILTGDVIDRTTFYVDAIVLALIPFRNKALY